MVVAYQNSSVFSKLHSICYNPDISETWGRINVSWKNVEKSRGIFSWADIDNAVQKCLDENIKIYMVISDIPEWIIKKDFTSRSDCFKQFCSFIFSRYGQKISIYGICNFVKNKKEFTKYYLIPGIKILNKKSLTALELNGSISIWFSWISILKFFKIPFSLLVFRNIKFQWLIRKLKLFKKSDKPVWFAADMI